MDDGIPIRTKEENIRICDKAVEDGRVIMKLGRGSKKDDITLVDFFSEMIADVELGMEDVISLKQLPVICRLIDEEGERRFRNRMSSYCKAFGCIYLKEKDV